MHSDLTLQRLPAVLAARGCGRSQHYLDIQKGLGTKPVSLGRGYAAWPSHETEALIAAQIGGAGEEAIQSLVRQLHEERKAVFAKVQSRYLGAALPRE